MVDQLTCGQYVQKQSLIQKLKIHSVHEDTPIVKTLLSFSLLFRKDQSLLHRPRSSGRECACRTNSLVGHNLHHLSLIQSLRSIQHIQTVQWPEHFFVPSNFYGGLVLSTQTKKRRKRICMMDHHFCGLVLTPTISCTKLKIHQAYAESPLAETRFLSL